MIERSKLRLIYGLSPKISLADRAALSLVHPSKRIDILSRDIINIKSRSEVTFATSRSVWTFQTPHVEIILKSSVCAKLRALTQRIIGDPLEIWVQDKFVSSSIVREPLGLQANFYITAFDLAAAQALTEQMTVGWIRERLTVVK